LCRGTEYKQAFLHTACADYLHESFTMMTDKLHLCLRSVEKMLSRLLFDVALKRLRIDPDDMLIACTARDCHCMAEALLEFLKEGDDDATPNVPGRGEKLLCEFLQATKPGGIIEWIARNARERDLGEHDQRVVALILFVVYNFPLQLHNHIVEPQEIPEEDCLSERVFALQESGLKMLFVLHHHFADWAVRPSDVLCGVLCPQVRAMQLRGYFLNLFFILPMQLPYNIAYWQGRGFAQFACCQWIELMVKLCNQVTNVAKHGVNQQYQKLRNMNLVQLWQLVYNNVRSGKRRDNGMRLDDRPTLQADKTHGIAVWQRMQGVGWYLEALETSNLRVRRWNGNVADVPRDGRASRRAPDANGMERPHRGKDRGAPSHGQAAGRGGKGTQKEAQSAGG